MKFLCGNCGSKYQISDDKVNGRVLRMKCRKCSNDIVIDGQHPTGPSVRPTAAATGTGTGSAISAPRAAAAPAPAAASRQAHPFAGPAPQQATRPATATGTANAGVRAPAAGRPATGPTDTRRGAVPAPAAPAPRAPAPAPRTTPGGTAPGAGLGAGFRRQVAVASARPAAPTSTASRNAALDQWHVAVNSVPVGPVGRAEVLRKMNAGAVNEDTLCWREGFDDWRPVREVPELAALLRQAVPSRPAPPLMAKSAPPARATASQPRQQVGSRPMPHPHRAGDALRNTTAARSNVVPIGGRLGGATAPAVDEMAGMDGLPAELPEDDFFGLPESDATVASAQSAAAAQAMMQAQPAAQVAAPAVAAAAANLDAFGTSPGAAAAAPAAMPVSIAPAPRRQLGVGAIFMIVMGGMFGAVMAGMIGYKFIFMDANQAKTVDVAKAAPEPEVGAKPIEGTVVRPPDEVVKEAVAKSNEVVRKKKREAAAVAAAEPEKPDTKELTAAEKAKLAAMGAGSSTNFDKFKDSGGIKLRGADTGDNAKGGSLNADQLRSVIAQGNPGLKQCYERVARSLGKAGNLRVDVDITVGGGGSVTKVMTRGDDGGGLGACITGLVKRWRFPAAGGETQTSFPLVFSGAS